MSLKGPTPEDERKLHAEINQIGNQRFLLTTLALTLFGVLTAWMVPKDNVRDTDIGAFPFAISIVLSVLLFSIYSWSHMLKNSMRVLSTYLAESGRSSWEVLWREFRQDGYFAQTKQQAFMFLVLLAIGTGFPFALLMVFSRTTTSILLPAIAVSISLIVGLLIYLMGFKNLFDKEAAIIRRWKKLLSEASKGGRE
jgi:hypothetical protein